MPDLVRKVGNFSGPCPKTQVQVPACLYGLQRRRQTGYLSSGGGSPSPSLASDDSAMDSFEFNKIAGAILGSCLFLVALNIAAGAIYAPATPAKPGFVIEIPKEPAGGAAKPAAEEPIEKLLASATVER